MHVTVHVAVHVTVHVILLVAVHVILLVILLVILHVILHVIVDRQCTDSNSMAAVRTGLVGGESLRTSVLVGLGPLAGL